MQQCISTIIRELPFYPQRIGIFVGRFGTAYLNLLPTTSKIRNADPVSRLLCTAIVEHVRQMAPDCNVQMVDNTLSISPIMENERQKSVLLQQLNSSLPRSLEADLLKIGIPCKIVNTRTVDELQLKLLHV